MIPNLFTYLSGCRPNGSRYMLAGTALLLMLTCPLAQAVVVADADGDGVQDSMDNCINTPNADQRDTDGDGYGNACDADLNNSGFVDAGDLSIFRSKYMKTPADPDADFNGDGYINATDLSIFRSLYRKAPGASCIDLPNKCQAVVARGDTYATPTGDTLTVTASRVSGVLYNDFIPDPATGESTGNTGLTAHLDTGPTHGTLSYLNTDGSFQYVPDGTQGDNDNDSFTYHAEDGSSHSSGTTTVNIHITSKQTDFKIMMNYELGMHCTGFEFSYCCVLPPYNSILAQVVKPQTTSSPASNADFPRLLTGDPNNGLDGLGRETVLRDYDGSGNFTKYYLEYYHDAQPRREGNMPGTFNDQTSTLISDVEGNSLLYQNTPYDSAKVDTDGSITGVPGSLIYGPYNGQNNVVQGNGVYTDPTDNFANGWLNHLYIFVDPAHLTPAGPNLEGENSTGTTLEKDKIRLGVTGMVQYPKNAGAALQPVGPNGNVTPFDNVLTFSGDSGTVVFTQMKVLENLPITLTSPRIWEALGLPLTPFEDSINFFADPGKVDEDSLRPFVAMKAALHTATCDASGNCTKGGAVIGSNGKPIIGFGTAPIDIPNCERCHSAPAYQADGVTPNVNSPSYQRRQGGPDPYMGPNGETLEAMTDMEINYWNALYSIDKAAGDTDWYSRLKGAAINMMLMHDYDNGTSFTANYPATGNPLGLPPAMAADPQNTRLGKESVICQKCHADNVIAVVKSAGSGGYVVPPITEAVHNTHRNTSEGGVIAFDDSLGRDGGCQGCHPAHRSDGTMDNYPIDRNGNNHFASTDNRLAAGGCFVGRDVHSNPLKDTDGAETPAHLTAAGQWLADNVFRNQDGAGGVAGHDTRGIWCTNCHTQLSQEVWKKENCKDLIHNDCEPGQDPRAAATLADLATDLNVSENQVIAWLDPTGTDLHGTGLGDFTSAIWKKDPGICSFLTNPTDPDQDAKVATIEVAITSGGAGQSCSTPNQIGPVDCSGSGGPVFNICGTNDADGDFSVHAMDFCTTPDCVAAAQATLTNSTAVAVPFSAADDARDHWLAAGEPHCADCHAAPYTEQSGNISAYVPFNYPRKASLMRYTRGHQDLSCQACHESIHGLYPVTPAIDNTSYAQAAALNYDGSHGPLKCGTCHTVNANGVPTWISSGSGAVGSQISSFDDAVTWAHTYTDEANVLNTTCQNCHGVNGQFVAPDTNSTPSQWTKVAVPASASSNYLGHAMDGRTSRQMMDKAEKLVDGAVLDTTDGSDGVCVGCHVDNSASLSCTAGWKQHLTQGRVSESVWEKVSLLKTGTRCGW